MRKETALKNYPWGSEIIFTSLPKGVAAKLYAFAAVSSEGDTIKINGVEYTLRFVSVNVKYDCVSVYFTYRNRLVRVSDHWCGVQRGFAPKGSTPINSVDKIATSWWRLQGQENSFMAPCPISGGKEKQYLDTGTGTVYSLFAETMISADRKIEGGWVPLHKIELYEGLMEVLKLHKPIRMVKR